MIRDRDRSYYIGASDTDVILRSWETKTFEKWYLEKMGFVRHSFSSDAMKAGTAYEHRILDALDISGMEKDRQVISGRLRVNLDGYADGTIYEVKTYKADKVFKPSKAYRDQVQVQMYATGSRKAFIAAYPLSEEEYGNFYRDIEKEKIELFPVEYDEDFIWNMYLPRYCYLAMCLDQGAFPKEESYGEFRKTLGSGEELAERKASGDV